MTVRLRELSYARAVVLRAVGVAGPTWVQATCAGAEDTREISVIAVRQAASIRRDVV